MTSINYDPKSFVISGKRTLLVMGEMHYARSPRAHWPALLDRARACGLNSVASYVFWSWHEPKRDKYDFSDDHDLGYFLKLCAERKLHVLLRMGPYCCAEWNYGGYPCWLRDEPEITIRTYNEPYLRRVEKYFEHLCAEVRPYLATRGGPIILAQVENEYANVAKRYGADGERYLVWMAELARRLGIDVPIIMCEGAAPNVIETVNGFSIPDERVAKFRRTHPDLPMIWTELWPSWYDTWGFQAHRRSAGNIAWHLLRFIGNGGAGWNYYMWHGGTNFGRTSMYLQTTNYDFDGPIDEYGRITAKGAYLARLHKVLNSHQELLVSGARERTTVAGGGTQIRWTLGEQSLTFEHDEKGAGRVISSDGHTLFDTLTDAKAVEKSWHAAEWQTAAVPEQWQVRPEPRPLQRTDGITAAQPVEGLSLTHDQSDYCWYSTDVSFAVAGTQVVEFAGCGDLIYLNLDGELVAQTQPPFRENRGSTTPEPGARPANDLELLVSDGFRQTFRINASAGKHHLEILTASLGLIKGDWQIAASMENERKGIWNKVSLNGKPVNTWTMHPCLVGEKQEFVRMSWENAPIAKSGIPCVWYRTEFAIPSTLLQADADFRLDANGLGKGMLFINGHALGRHWLIPGNGYGADEVWHQPILDGLWLDPAGEPTQRWYHVPQSWLAASNTLVLFEEQACLPDKVRLEVRKHVG